MSCGETRCPSPQSHIFRSWGGLSAHRAFEHGFFTRHFDEPYVKASRAGVLLRSYRGHSPSPLAGVTCSPVLSRVLREGGSCLTRDDGSAVPDLSGFASALQSR